jgi:hypothetical protein
MHLSASGRETQQGAGARRSATAIARSTYLLTPPCALLKRGNEMFSINDQKNHARQLLSLLLATAILTSLVAITNVRAFILSLNGSVETTSRC